MLYAMFTLDVCIDVEAECQECVQTHYVCLYLVLQGCNVKLRHLGTNPNANIKCEHNFKCDQLHTCTC